MPATKTKKPATAATTAPAKKAPKAKPPAPAKRMSALDAAAKVLGEAGRAMSTKEMIEAMAAKRLWESPAGKTPAATLYAAILREVATKGAASRFQKTEPGKFAAAGAAGATAAPAAKTAQPKAAKAGKAKPAKKKATKTAEAAPATIPDGTPGPESMSELFRL